MKIGIETHHVEKEGSGNCTYMKNLIRNLAITDDRNEYILYCTDKNYYFYEEIRKLNKNFKIVELNVKNLFLKIPFYLGIKTFKDNLDVLHTVYFCPLISRAKKVITIHDILPAIAPKYFSHFEVFKHKFALKFFIKKADKIITISNWSKVNISKYFKLNKNKITKIYPGVSAEFVIIDKRNKSDVLKKFKINEPYIYYVGRLDLRKNLENLIKVFPEVIYNNKSLSLVIAGGENKYFERLNNLVLDYGLREKIKFIGQITLEDNIALLNFSKLFIYPSFCEGFGLPILEAMACGCPVITSRGSALEEVAGDSALLIDPNDRVEIRNAIINILENEKLRIDFIEKGRERIKEFTWEFCAKETIKIYESLLK